MLRTVAVLFHVLLFALSLSAQESPLWLRYPAISPDGNSILFNYQGDIYKTSASGGMAMPLTLSESYEYAGVWSNDGEKIAFASDRFGNFDVFVMPAAGGTSQRLTFHSNGEKPSAFSPDDEHILLTTQRQDLHTNVQFPSGVMAELYSVPTTGGRVNLVINAPAHDATYSPDGTRIIYHDRKGYENEWRKHHTSAVTRDVWLYDLAYDYFTQLSTFEGEDRNPVFAANGTDYYYLSERDGSFNVYRGSVDDVSSHIQITRFKDHPVRFLTIANNGTLCFSYHGEVYTMVPGEEPQKVEVVLAFDGRQSMEKTVKVNGGFTEASLSPNGKEVAYVFRGEIFVSSVEHGTTKRITNTGHQERSVSFSPDGRSLVYAAEVNESWDIHQTSIVREDEKYFFASTLLKEEPIIATPAEEFQPAYSPDGKEVAYLKDRTTLNVVEIESKNTRTILPAEYNYSYADGDMWYQWSPDGKWFLVNYGVKEAVMSGEVGLIAASGDGEIHNLSQSGYEDAAPIWGMDGKMVAWASSRMSNRGENGWPTDYDIYGLFLNQQAFDRFNLSKEELSLLEEKEKEEAKKEKEKKKDEDKEEKKDDEAKKDTVSIDWNNLTDRKRKLTVHTSRLRDFLLSKKGDKLYYLTSFEGRYDVWETDLRSRETKKFVKLGARSAGMQLSKDGEFMLVLADGKLNKVELKSGNKKSISTKGEMILKRDEERAYIFDHAWRQVREKFYVEDLQGVDWDFYKAAYQPFLPYINNNYDFAEMLSELLGELNASHTGSGYRHRPENGDQTASLGLLYDYAHKGDGLLVAEVLQGGPLDRAASKVSAGHLIEKIDGQAVTTGIDFYQLLNRRAGENVLLSLFDPAKDERWDEVVKPISLGTESQLLYKRWVETRREATQELSEGKLGYVHVRGMNDASMRVVIEEALGKHISADALIVDTRFNGGGNLHDVLSDFLTGEKYMEIIPHGQYVGHQPGNRWVKPSIVIMGESNYSDAHLFPVAYKIKGGGQTLGMPVPGTGTFVWWETQIDPTIYFGIPMGGWRPLGQPFLENNQMEPDIRVPNEPGPLSEGSDQQLEAAVRVLLNGE